MYSAHLFCLALCFLHSCDPSSSQWNPNTALMNDLFYLGEKLAPRGRDRLLTVWVLLWGICEGVKAGVMDPCVGASYLPAGQLSKPWDFSALAGPGPVISPISLRFQHPPRLWADTLGGTRDVTNYLNVFPYKCFNKVNPGIRHYPYYFTSLKRTTVFCTCYCIYYKHIHDRNADNFSKRAVCRPSRTKTALLEEQQLFTLWHLQSNKSKLERALYI